LRTFTILLLLTAFSAAQTSNQAPQVILDNGFIRVSRITNPAESPLAFESDSVVVRLQDETARFIPKGDRFKESDTTDRGAVKLLLVEIKKHWDAEVRPCTYPMKCTHETTIGNEPIAWATTLFTNGFITAATHKVKRGGTLTSSYYTAKGTDQILLIPFTDLKANFGGIEESLKAGQPYFTTVTEVEVAATDAESRWFVLRVNAPK
jgi:hypothetical protein